ncbi:MAG: amino acid ABC transporter permease [Syntrophomonadaceae bacterium]|jgi:His/Glu/Gln/Arg/opine family amino acid ABC transporter permease subunit|nr:amino acid ABC transporter permease [Syntrophomonadaceae bacterium]
MLFDLAFVERAIPLILGAIPITLLLTIMPMIVGTILGFLIALTRNNRIPVLDPLASLFVSFIRGTPIFVLLFLFYYALPRVLGVGIKTIPALATGLLTLSFVCTGYLSEIIRGALKSVDMYQMEAARSIGMTSVTAYRRIILPQAIVVAMPNYFNFTANMLKNSSLVFGIGVIDIMAVAKVAAEGGYRYIESYTIVAVLYVLFSLLFSAAFRYVEYVSRRRMGAL